MSNIVLNLSKKSLGLEDKDRNAVSIPENQLQDVDSERLKQLEDENLKLRIENTYLKELRRLHLEDEARLREQQESSTASEETSNWRTFSHIQDFQKLRICTGRNDLTEKIQMLSLKT